LGWATITHPFHPFRGQKFQVLQIKKIAEKEILSLKTKEGPFAMERDWTDMADPNPYDGLADQTPILSGECLLQLVEMAKILSKKKKMPS
jgi:hypothetical protein